MKRSRSSGLRATATLSTLRCRLSGAVATPLCLTTFSAFTAPPLALTASSTRSLASLSASSARAKAASMGLTSRLPQSTAASLTLTWNPAPLQRR